MKYKKVFENIQFQITAKSLRGYKIIQCYLSFLQNYVYVYDGIPDSMTGRSSSSAMLLAAFCGFGYSEPRSVQAKSGFMTVYFDGSIDSSKRASQLVSRPSQFTWMFILRAPLTPVHEPQSTQARPGLMMCTH